MIPLSEAADRLNRAAIGLQKRREVDRIAAKHRPKISAFFRQQKVRTLEELGKFRFLFTEEYRRMREEVHPNEFLTTHDWERMWQEIYRDTFDELQRVIAGVESDGVLQGGNQLARLINPTGKFWDLANPRAVEFFLKTGGSISYISGIQETTKNGIRPIIEKSIEKGWGYQRTAKVISDKFDDIARDRAQRIAVFESGQAYEAGNRMFAETLRDDGLEMQEHWMTSHDEKVRPEHAANEAEGWVELGHVYSSGHTDPPTDPNCRCYKIYRQVPK